MLKQITFKFRPLSIKVQKEFRLEQAFYQPHKLFSFYVHSFNKIMFVSEMLVILKLKILQETELLFSNTHILSRFYFLIRRKTIFVHSQWKSVWII